MKALTFLFSLFLINSIVAQGIDYNWVIPSLDKPGITFEEKLVAIAWQNYPQNKILQHELGAAKAKVEEADKSWANGLGFNTQYNGGSGAQTVGSDGTIIPGFNNGFGVGVSLSLGAIISKKSRVKAAMEEAKIVEEQINLQKLSVRAEVLKRYQNYRLSTDILQLHVQNLGDIHSGYLSKKQLYSQGEISLEEYNTALSAYSKAQVEKVESESKVIVARRELEEVLGVPWDSIQEE